MKFSATTVALFAALIPSISAHLIMTNPTQWFVADKTGSSVETSEGQQNPLLADGSNFPCPGVPPSAPVATYVPGAAQTLQIVGSAVHGGGSGQMSITYDKKPTANSQFRVMTSWMGDHPVKADGNLPADPTHQLPALTFTVPKGLPAGPAVVAWTWFNRIGNREMYMKCATVMIGGSETSTAALDALPTMFRANSGNSCQVKENIAAIAFKSPGPQTFGVGTTPVACDNTQPGSGTGTGTGTPVVSPVPTPVMPSKSAVPSAVPSASAKPVAPSSTPATGPAAPAGGPCVEGKVTCNADGTWSQCGSGVNQNMGPVTPGMTCSNGQFSKRSIRFSHVHRRRHIYA